MHPFTTTKQLLSIVTTYLISCSSTTTTSTTTTTANTTPTPTVLLPPTPSSTTTTTTTITNKRATSQQWNDALQKMKSSEPDRSKLDRRAKLATLVGIYFADNDNNKNNNNNNGVACSQQDNKYISNEKSGRGSMDMIVAAQPDRSSGRKLVFMERESGNLLGYLLLETSSYEQHEDSENNSNKDTSELSASSLLLGDDSFVEQQLQGHHDDNKNNNNENGATSISDDSTGDTPTMDTTTTTTRYTSSLRGMEIEKAARGKGYSTLFMRIWLNLCRQANHVTPATVSINKPLLALTLLRFGFTPMVVAAGEEEEEEEHQQQKQQKTTKLIATTQAGTYANDHHVLNDHRGEKKKVKEKTTVVKKKKQRNSIIRKTALAVEVITRKGGDGGDEDDGMVYLYCDSEDDFENLQAGFTKTELQSQNLVLLQERPLQSSKGRVIQIRTKYVPPFNMEDHMGLNHGHRGYGGGLLHLQNHKNKNGEDHVKCTTTASIASNDSWKDRKDEISRFLTGRLRGFNDQKKRLEP